MQVYSNQNVTWCVFCGFTFCRVKSGGGVLKVESTLPLDRAWSHFFARAK